MMQNTEKFFFSQLFVRLYVMISCAISTSQKQTHMYLCVPFCYSFYGWKDARTHAFEFICESFAWWRWSLLRLADFSRRRFSWRMQTSFDFTAFRSHSQCIRCNSLLAICVLWINGGICSMLSSWFIFLPPFFSLCINMRARCFSLSMARCTRSDFFVFAVLPFTPSSEWWPQLNSIQMRLYVWFSIFTWRITQTHLFLYARVSFSTLITCLFVVLFSA